MIGPPGKRCPVTLPGYGGGMPWQPAITRLSRSFKRLGKPALTGIKKTGKNPRFVKIKNQPLKNLYRIKPLPGGGAKVPV